MSNKVMDHKNRWRCKTVSFRMSLEEAEQLDRFVRISGLAKQDYLVGRALQQDIVVIGSPRVYKMLRKELAEVCRELKRIENSECLDQDLMDLIQQINTTMNGLKEESYV